MGSEKNCSTATAIFKLSRDLHSAYDLGYSTSCIFVDYKKAFETLSHKILMEKMHAYGLSQKSIRWLNSYLENRRHVVDCNGYQSEQSHVPYGVPQGSILGPSLFVIYVNDLLYLMGENNVASIEMYADDTVLHVSDSCAMKAMGQSNAAMDMLYLWCIRNKLTINFSKTKHMLIPRNEVQEGKSEHKHINVSTFILNNVSSYHYLGIDLDKYLTFEKMAESTFSKANKKLYLLKKIRPYISCAVANRVYKSHVLPIFDYADFLIDSCRQTTIDSFVRLQKRAVHTIDYKTHHGMTYAQLLDLYGLMSLAERRRKHQLCLMYRLSHNLDYIDRRRPDINLRSNQKVKFKLKHTRLSKISNSPYHRAVRLWDRLSLETQRSTTKVKFKKALN